LEAQRHFSLVHIQVQLLMTTIADHHHVVDVSACALLQKHQLTILVPGINFHQDSVSLLASQSLTLGVLFGAFVLRNGI